MYVTECDVRRAAWWSPPPVRFETCSENITFEPSFPSTGAACRNCRRKQSWRTGYEAQAHLDNHRGRLSGRIAAIFRTSNQSRRSNDEARAKQGDRSRLPQRDREQGKHGAFDIFFSDDVVFNETRNFREQYLRGCRRSVAPSPTIT